MNKNLIGTILKSVALAMGIAVVVCSVLNAIDTKSAIILLSIGLFCLALNSMRDKDKK